MATGRLNADERATYLIGHAIRRQFKEGADDPDSRKEMRAVELWLEHWLTPDNLHDIMLAAGWVLGPDRQAFEDYMESPLPPLHDDDDSVPF